MDSVLLSLAVILLLIGMAGCLLPVVPGPPVSYLALLIVNFTKYAGFTTDFLIITALLAIAVTVADLFIPVWATKKFGGSKYGMWGAGIGIFAGIFFFPPLGLVLGPLAGAIAGELISGSGGRKAVVAGLGSFAGFIAGVGLKLGVSLAITIYFVREVFMAS
jgi:uncharacterized protein